MGQQRSTPSEKDGTHKINYAQARRVIDALERHDVSPTAENYGLWARHLCGIDNRLSDSIRSRIESGQPIDAEFMALLRQQYYYPGGDDGNHSEVISNTHDVLIGALNVMTGIIREADDQHEHIQDHLKRIIDQQDELDINELLQVFVSAAKDVNETSRDIRANLKKSYSAVFELKQDLVELSDELNRDFLTGVLNRRGFERQLTRLMETAEKEDTPLSLLLLDIDHFKQFNDNYGHLIGDEVLKMVAKMLADSIKGKDVVARFGGEEFVIVLPDTPIQGGYTVAEQIRAAIAHKEMYHRSSGHHYGSVTISVGVALYNTQQDTRESWFARADQALYISKSSGRNRVTRLQCNEQYQRD